MSDARLNETRDCIHGQLARSCEICELTAELAAAAKHANDLGDLLAKVEAERDALAEKVNQLNVLALEMLESHKPLCGDCEMVVHGTIECCSDFEDFSYRLAVLSDNQEGE